MRILLVPFSWLYGAIIAIRNLLFDLGIFRIVRVSVPVISVGNMTTGGTGKTPFVGYLVRSLTASGKRVAVISRGYKRRTTGTVIVSDGKSILSDPFLAGDEAFQTALKFPAAIVIVDHRRSRAAKLAVNTYHVDAIVLDDAFQHRGIARDLDIVMVDGSDLLSDIPLLPAGMRRESMSGLRRSDLFVMPAGAPESAVSELSGYSEAETIRTRIAPTRLVRLADGVTVELQSMKGEHCFGVCGIANAHRFKKTLEDVGFIVDAFTSFGDHHEYTEADIAAVGFRNPGPLPRIVVTTAKDAVKLNAKYDPGVTEGREWYTLEIETEIVSGEEILQEHLKRVLTKGEPARVSTR